MSYFERAQVQYSDSFSIDAFGRARVSEPTTLFDSKQLYDKSPNFFDEVVAGTASSTHSTADASVTMAVSANNDYVIRQTKQRFNYQPGKSHEILCTFVLGATTANVIKRVGYFNSSTVAPYTDTFDGIYLEDNGTNVGICVAKGGTVNRVAKTAWNVDKFDGTGPSGVTIDFTKAHIFFIDFEWLGVGRVRAGFVIDGKIYYAHYFNHANSVTAVYMSSSNHSVRYEIRSTGGASSMQHICSSVASEGGSEQTGIVRSFNTGITPADAIDSSLAGTKYAMIGIRLKTTHLDSNIILVGLGTMCTSGSNFMWEIYLNPTVAGTFTYVDITNSAVQIAKGDTVNDPSNSTVTGGTLIASGYVSANSDSVELLIPSNLKLGSTIAGVRDELVMCVSQTAASGEDYYAQLTWREQL